MSSTLTFGIELEFALGLTTDMRHSNFHASRPDGRTTSFHPLEKDYAEAKDRESFLSTPITGQQLRSVKRNAHQFAAARHIKRLLRAHGVPTEKLKPERDLGKWRVSFDGSVKGPRSTAYEWVDIEIVSPAMPYNEDSLREVEKVCALLREKYLTETNQTTGCHVHVGQGNAGYTFQELKRIVSFLWAFTPQLDTLHPSHRVDEDYAQNFRFKSKLAHRWWRGNGEWPSSSQALVALARCVSLKELFDTVLPEETKKHCTYNFEGLWMLSQRIRASFVKPTIEFRQHRGTLDGEAATQWIRVVVGIVQFVRDVHPQTYVELMCMAYDETWQKLGDGKDAERERLMGPIYAEKCFGVIDLLNFIGLREQAEFYTGKTFIHQKAPISHRQHSLQLLAPHQQKKQVPTGEMPLFRTKWQYEIGDPESEEYKRAHTQRHLWEDLQRLHELLPAETRTYLSFDPDGTEWPEHTTFTVVEPKPLSPIVSGSSSENHSSETSSSGTSREEDEMGENVTHRERPAASESSGMVDGDSFSEPSELAAEESTSSS